MRWLLIMSVCLLVSVWADDTPVDLTLQPGEKGKDIVDACIGRINLAQVFQDDAGMLRRIAWVETQFGEAEGTTTCIWGVTPTMFEIVSPSQSTKDAILVELGIDWDQVDVSDLEKPLYCALAARILFADCQTDLPLSLDLQADLWATCYNTQGNMQTYIDAVNELEQESECKIPGMDMVFVLDGSGSVGADNFETVKDFVVSVVDGFEIGRSRTRIGVVQYSNEVVNEFNLTEYDNKPDVQSAISNITYLQGRTYTGAALRYMTDFSFSEEAGARPPYQAIPKVGIVVTDGEATDTVRGPADRAHEAGINVFAIGIGSGYNRRELNEIATDPDATHVFGVDNFAATDYIKDALEGRTCKEPAEVAVGQTVQGDLPQGTLQFLSFRVRIRRGMTFKLKMRVGSVNFFLSIRIRNPNRALYDFRLRTRPNKMRLDIFIPPSRLRELLGRERRQAVVDDDEEVELFAAIEGVDGTNQFDLETDDGDTADPAYLDNGSPRAAVSVLTLVMLLITAIVQ
ncbi:uncharacterized protein [Branchiostoma lanceolatum]|uniref:uncharacterized protein n=1 Tax=Branchiostoma lanceolatum TaxID=7740 RepID=UPI0034529026